MGLDMMACTLNARPPTDVDFELTEKSGELWQWRKHPNLHGWMEALYRSKGGGGVDGMDGPDTFNCVPVLLTSEDLDSLELAVRTRTLPSTEGFFFGNSEPEDQAGDLKFIAKAREAIAAGKFVYYTSWW
jgi:hypothetical protein